MFIVTRWYVLTNRVELRVKKRIKLVLFIIIRHFNICPSRTIINSMFIHCSNLSKRVFRKIHSVKNFRANSRQIKLYF